MQVTVTGRHMDVTDALRVYAEQKFGRVSKIFDAEPLLAEIVLRAEKNPSIASRNVAEVTLRLQGGVVVRAEEAAPDMHAAIDLAADKAEVQMRKYKTRIIDRRNGKIAATVVKTASGDAEIKPEKAPEVVRVKLVDAQPMSQQEAILQLELLGHDFFVYRDTTTSGVAVLYRRKDGDYGVIQPTA